jgi:hypothetical protein
MVKCETCGKEKEYVNGTLCMPCAIGKDMLRRAALTLLANEGFIDNLATEMAKVHLKGRHQQGIECLYEAKQAIRKAAGLTEKEGKQ